MAHDGAPLHQVWLRKAERFKRYLPGKSRTDGHSLHDHEEDLSFARLAADVRS